jgi:protein-S-isoprenylcysteine O-methyltransferase Ste14
MMPVAYVNSRGELGELLNLFPIGVWDYAGWSIFAIGIVIQVVADCQKYSFRNNPENKEKFCRVGVWNWSRHPNYFGEILIWSGAFLCVIPVISFKRGTTEEIAAGVVSVLSPLFTMLILIGGSGIPQAEGKNLKRYYDAGRGQEWEDYAAQTSPVVLFPNVMYRALPAIVKCIFCCELSAYKYRKQNGATELAVGVKLVSSEKAERGENKPPHHNRDSTELPPGWNKHVDPTGKKYYGNKDTKESSWKAPDGSTGGSSDVMVLKKGITTQSSITEMATNPLQRK